MKKAFKLRNPKIGVDGTDHFRFLCHECDGEAEIVNFEVIPCKGYAEHSYRTKCLQCGALGYRKIATKWSKSVEWHFPYRTELDAENYELED